MSDEKIVCALCGTDEIDVEVMIKSGSDIKHRGLCKEHGDQLSEWWREQHQRIAPDSSTNEDKNE